MRADNSTVFKDQGDCFGEAIARFSFRFALSIRSRNFETVGNIPRVVVFNYCCEFVSHTAVSLGKGTIC